MNTTLLIAADSIRALLRQRLLLGLMLLALILLAVFSALAIGQKKAIVSGILDESAAREPADTTAAGQPVAKEPASGPTVVVEVKRGQGREASLSKEDRQRLAESMDSLSSVLQAGFYQAASFGGSLVSLFIFSATVAQEIRRGTIRITLTKPVSRTQYILGKYLGGVAVMAGYAIIASTAIVLFARFSDFELSPAMKYAPWLMFCRQLMLGSFAMLLSLVMHPFLGAVLSFFAGNGFYGASNPLYYLLPSYDAFNLTGEMLRGKLVSGHDVALLSFYALDFVVLMLALALWRFRTKELV